MPHGSIAEAPGFDAILFDLDGTLVATDRFWIEAAERGTRRAFQELGLARAIPAPKEWLTLVGMPIEVGFEALFPDLAPEERRHVLRACMDEEARLLADGRALAMPGARALLAGLHAQGVRIGIASNCHGPYLGHMLRELELQPSVDAAFCRDSPGVRTKTDMVARLLEEFDTRSAVMVGDRASDRDAAWANRIPHVHCAFGFAQGDEVVEAEGRIESLDELPALLARRGRWIDHALERLGAFRPGFRLGIIGVPGAGKTLFARDAGRRIRARGLAVAAISLDCGHPEGHPELEASLEPAARADARIPLGAPDLLGQDAVPAGAIVLLEGRDLHTRRASLRLDRVIRLDPAPAGREGSEDPARAREEPVDLELRCANPLGEEPPPVRGGRTVLGALSPGR